MFKKKFRVIALMLCIVLMMGCFVVNTEAVSTVLLAVQGAIVDGNLVKFSGINGIGVDTGVSATNVVKCKFDATSAPTGNNDVDEGYTVGSRWLDVTNDKSYVCLDNTDGAAVWHLDVVGPGSSTDHAIVRWDSTTGRTTLDSVVTVGDTGVMAGGEWQGTVISPVYGGTGIANNAASTITISGNFATTITVTNVTAITLPTAGIVVSDNNACTDLEGTLLAIAGGTLNVTIPEDHITPTMLKDDNAPADEDIFCYELTGTTGHWYSRVEVGIGVATSITDGIIKEADLDADAVAVGDILTYDDGGVDFLWKTKAELSIASSGANIDITSILNTALYVGRDADNNISWAVDDTLGIKIGGVLISIVDIETGGGDNDSLVTQGYVDDIVAGANVALSNLAGVAINTSLLSDAVDTDDLGSAAKEWRSIYVGTAGKIYLGLSQEISLEVTDANTLYITAADNVSLSGGLIVAGTVALAANNLTMTGSLAATGARVTKGWFTDIESTNAPTVDGAQIDSGDLSDVASIGMLDENEIVTVCWYFHDNVWIEMANDGAGYYPLLGHIRSRDGDPTYIVTTGDILGMVSFSGARNEDPLNGLGAVIQAVAEGTFALNDYPTRLDFLTTPDDSGTNTLRMTIDNAGNVKMGDGVWTDFIQVTAAGVTTAEGSATIAATTVTSFTPAGGSLILAGADALTITTAAATGVTLPTSGTLLANVSEDATPTAGGPFDLNEFAIDFSDDLGDDHDYSGITDSAPVGENVVFGQILYRDWTDVEWKLAQADAYATARGLRIALESKADGETCLMLVIGYIRDDSAFDFGAAAVFLNDDTAGACDDTAPAESGDQIQIVGTAISANAMFFYPSQDVGEI